MFARLGRFTVRHKVWVVAFWLLLAVAMAALAPRLSEVGEASDTAFLPPDAPSLQAQQVLQQTFPDLVSAGDLLVVLYAPQGLSEGDRAYARDLAAWLASSQAPEDVRQVTSVFDHPELEPLLISTDGKVMLMQVDLKSEPYSDSANQTVDRLREKVAAARPEGLQVYLTGQAAIGRDLTHHILESVDKTTWATILLVVVILLLVYRAPLAAGVPLFTIGTAYVITRGILGYLAQAGWMKVSSIVDAFIVVLVFGVGTDYALFLISRYREEVARRANHDREAADVETVVKIGPVLTASAATVIIGTLGMMVARFQMTESQGPAMALGIAVALLASLTLTPALLSLLGAHLFWPFHRRLQETQEEHRSPLWERIAAGIARRPGWTALAITALMLLPYLFLGQMRPSFDMLKELPSTAESRVGFEVIQAHFDAGEFMPLTVVLTDTQALDTPEGLARIAAVHQALAQVEGVSLVRSVAHPTGGEDPDLERSLLAREQVLRLADEMEANLSADPAALTSTDADPAQALGQLQAYLDELAVAFPEVAQDPAYQAAQDHLRALTAQWETFRSQMQVHTQLQWLLSQVPAASPDLAGGAATAGEVPAPGLDALQAYLDELARAYPDVQDDPGYRQAMQALTALLQAQEAARQLGQVSGQLALLTQAVGDFATALQDPQALSALAAGPTPQQPAPADALALVGAYLQELAQAYPEVQSNPAFGDALARLQSLQARLATLASQQAAEGAPPPPEQIQPLLTALTEDTQALTQDLGALAQAFSGRDAPLTSQALLQSAVVQAQQDELKRTLDALREGLVILDRRFAERDAPFLPTSLQPLMAAQGNDPAQAVQEQVTALTAALRQVVAALPANAYFLPAALLEAQPEAAKLLATFLSADGHAALIQVLLRDEPYSTQALETVQRLRAVADQATQAQGMTAYLTGPSAQVADIRQIVNEDFPRVMAVVVAGVLVVLVLLLGSLVAPVYLVGTVLLSYGTTMGLVTLLFQDGLGHPGVNYAIPIVIFVLLVALGADYNIFLTSRIWEEAERHGDVREGVRHASAYTGGVITSAGLILAGTFAALMVSSLQNMFQIGAAVAVGVLLDTFVVRALLVPSIAVLVDRWNWWPAPHPIGHGGLFRLLAERLRRR